MEARSLFEWSDVFFEYVGFVSSFAILGPIGFRYGVLRSPAGDAGAGEGARAATDGAAAGAAGIGVVGALLGVVSLLEGLFKRAEAKHVTLGDAFAAGGSATVVQAALLGGILVLFVLAWRRVAVAWPVAALAALAFALRGILGGRLAGMVNPLHVLGASLWLGTLFVLVTCGVGQMLRPSVGAVERESAVADMVRRFSMLALGSAALLGVTGVITAWKHLNPLAALWTTPYGYALDAKLFVVAIVAALGAWNWRRVGPSLGNPGGALGIRRSASVELVFAGIVLGLTAILVSVPSPKLPH